MLHGTGRGEMVSCMWIFNQSGLKAALGVHWQHVSWAVSAAAVANGTTVVLVVCCAPCQGGRQGATRHDKRLRLVPQVTVFVCMCVCVVGGVKYHHLDVCCKPFLRLSAVHVLPVLLCLQVATDQSAYRHFYMLHIHE